MVGSNRHTESQKGESNVEMENGMQESYKLSLAQDIANIDKLRQQKIELIKFLDQEVNRIEDEYLD